MAIANLSPPDRGRLEQQASRILRMQSPDPVTRWQAREEQIAEAAREYSDRLIQQAEQSRKALEAQERAAERYERENPKYRPLPPGAKVSK